MYDDKPKMKLTAQQIVRGIGIGTGSFVLIIALLFGISALGKSYSRYQKREDAKNNAKVTQINIQRAQQQARIVLAEVAATKAEAQKRFQESIGLRRAQNEIRKTLTPLYIQHEAIQAQIAMAHSSNHTIIWAPAGASGVPIVTDPLAETRGR